MHGPLNVKYEIHLVLSLKVSFSSVQNHGEKPTLWSLWYYTPLEFSAYTLILLVAFL
jgi:hypothetical protein